LSLREDGVAANATADAAHSKGSMMRLSINFCCSAIDVGWAAISLEVRRRTYQLEDERSTAK
jgi:hypothetical protein